MSQSSLSLCLCLISSSFVPFTLPVNATTPGKALLSFLDGFSSISVPSTLLLKGTTGAPSFGPHRARWSLVHCRCRTRRSASIPRPQVGLLLVDNTQLCVYVLSQKVSEANSEASSEKARRSNEVVERLCVCAERQIRELTRNYGGALHRHTYRYIYIARAPRGGLTPAHPIKYRLSNLLTMPEWDTYFIIKVLSVSVCIFPATIHDVM